MDSYELLEKDLNKMKRVFNREYLILILEKKSRGNYGFYMKFFIISRKIKTYTLQRYYHITFYIYKIKFLYLYHLYKPATYFCTILPFSFPFFSPKNIYFIFFHIHENKTTFFFRFYFVGFTIGNWNTSCGLWSSRWYRT